MAGESSRTLCVSCEDRDEGSKRRERASCGRASRAVGLPEPLGPSLVWGLGKLYEYRSQVAHTGVLRSKDTSHVSEQFQAYEHIAASVVQRLILTGPPAWDELVLGGNDGPVQG